MPESAARLAQLESDHGHLERTGKILASYQRECTGPPIVPQAASGQGEATFSPYGVAGAGGVNGAAERAKAFTFSR
jgi:hypothetical protein